MVKWWRKRPVVVEAVRWEGDNLEEVQAFCPTITIYDNPLRQFATFKVSASFGETRNYK